MADLMEVISWVRFSNIFVRLAGTEEDAAFACGSGGGIFSLSM